MMRTHIGTFLALLICVACLRLAVGGDALYGKVVKVKSADVVTLDYGTGQYDVRLIGIEVTAQVAVEAAQFISNLALDKNADVHFDNGTKKGELLGRLFVQEAPSQKMRDAGLELVRAGLAVRQKDFDYKDGSLSLAETEARKERRGIWKSAQP